MTEEQAKEKLKKHMNQMLSTSLVELEEDIKEILRETGKDSNDPAYIDLEGNLLKWSSSLIDTMRQHL